MVITRLHILLHGELAAWLVAGYLAALLQPVVANLWHEMDHLYSVAKAEADHSYADHVHAYDFQEHDGVLKIMLRLLMEENSGDAPVNGAIEIQTGLNNHILNRVPLNADAPLTAQRFFAVLISTPADHLHPCQTPPPEGDVNISILLELC